MILNSDEYDKLMQQIKKQEDDEVKRIYVEENDKQTNLTLTFQSGSEQYATLTNEDYEYHLSTNSIEILKYIITERQKDAVICANGYYKSGRDYQIFLYDLVTLCWFLENLPNDFDPLKKINNGDKELLHNRLVSQLAFKYKKIYNGVEFEKKNRGHIPDLHMANIDVEIKTILNPVISEEDYKSFYDNFKRQFQKAVGQVNNQGMIVIGFWSKRINNELREYFSNLLHDEPINVKNNTAVIVLEGDVPLLDYYVVIPSNYVLEIIGNYCNGGYRRVDPMAYMKTMMRNGFPYQKRFSNPSDVFFMHRQG